MTALGWADIVEGRRRGAAAGCLRLALAPPSLAYRLAVAARNAAFDRGLLRARRLPRPVISVGNLAVGGAGKTPFAMLLARGLRARGLRAAVLSRGYGASAEGPFFPRLVSNGAGAILSPREAGDEAHLLARGLPGTVVAIDPDRLRAGEMAARRFPVDVFILDDGFQHRRLRRDLDILLLDGTNPFGNGRLLPAGRLREPPSAARRADAIVFTRCPGPPPPHALRRLRELGAGARIFTATHQPARLARPGPGPVEDPASLRKTPVAAFCGLAEPEGFFRTLEGLGARVVLSRRFPDHHPYRPAEIETLARAAAAAGAAVLVTTAKDAVRIPETPTLPLPLRVLEIEMKIGGGEAQMLEWVFESLGTAARRGKGPAPE